MPFSKNARFASDVEHMQMLGDGGSLSCLRPSLYCHDIAITNVANNPHLQGYPQTTPPTQEKEKSEHLAAFSILALVT